VHRRTLQPASLRLYDCKAHCIALYALLYSGVKICLLARGLALLETALSWALLLLRPSHPLTHSLPTNLHFIHYKCWDASPPIVTVTGLAIDNQRVSAHHHIQYIPAPFLPTFSFYGVLSLFLSFYSYLHIHINIYIYIPLCVYAQFHYRSHLLAQTEWA